MPRWWIAYGREPVHRDPEGLGWRLSPPGLEVRTAAKRLDSDGRITAQAQSDPLATQWAAAMTAHYDELANLQPVFAQLRGCMDLVLVTAILASGDLLAHVGLELPMLLDERRLQLAPHPVPKTVASEASALRRSREGIVTVSGGVDLDVASPVNNADGDQWCRKHERTPRQMPPTHGGGTDHRHRWTKIQNSPIPCRSHFWQIDRRCEFNVLREILSCLAARLAFMFTSFRTRMTSRSRSLNRLHDVGSRRMWNRTGAADSGDCIMRTRPQNV